METCMTLSAVITPITEKTPIVTPNIVRPDRSLFAFSAVSAMRMISRKFMAKKVCGPALAGQPAEAGPHTDVSLVPQRFDRIEARRGQRRREAAENAGQSRDDQPDEHKAEREGHRKRRKCGCNRRRHQPGDHQTG